MGRLSVRGTLVCHKTMLRKILLFCLRRDDNTLQCA